MMITYQMAYLDKITKEAHSMNFGEFRKHHPDVPQHLYSLVKQSKQGYIEITKVSDNPGYLSSGETVKGNTPCFGEQLAVWIDREDKPDFYFHTSTIQDIDWENEVFHTLNSTYKFKFKENDTVD